MEAVFDVPSVIPAGIVEKLRDPARWKTANGGRTVGREFRCNLFNNEARRGKIHSLKSSGPTVGRARNDEDVTRKGFSRRPRRSVCFDGSGRFQEWEELISFIHRGEWTAEQTESDEKRREMLGRGGDGPKYSRNPSASFQTLRTSN